MMPKILVLPGSIRSGSFNIRLAAAAATALAGQGADVTRISLEDYPLPIMDQDLQEREGIPENAMQLGRMIAAHDGLFIASPEYNSSIPPLLKNAIDWVSRINSDRGRPFRPWTGRIIGLGAASNGRFGGVRCLYHLRAVLMSVRAEVITAQCAISGAAQAFDDDGHIIDERARLALDGTCQALIAHCSALMAR
ncbi:MAG TPA: NAD(P)H-dependent oxidoreductase [Pararhizobium sp.]|nr:NAD(P)H-dependent oxidoreductase [Pararhizobium sp.]